MPDPLIGQTIGRYEIVGRLGHGGMGVVYRGRQMSLNRTVAIKFLPLQMASDEEFVQRFRQEAEVIAGLAHENIVYVYDIDEHEGTWYIVMEFIDGHSLRQLRGQQVFSAEEVRAIGIPLARALDYAHQRGIVHRDIKSANVMVTREGKVKLMDFGIAKAAGSGVKTITGSVLGTPEYMSPEQARSGRVTPQSDVYSLGVLLYELSTGTLPFEAEDPFAVALRHVSEAPEPPSARKPDVPDWLEEIILRAMAKSPGERYVSAADLERDLLQAGADRETGAGPALESESPTRQVGPETRPSPSTPPPPPTPPASPAGATPPPPPRPDPPTSEAAPATTTEPPGRPAPGVPSPRRGIPPRWLGLGVAVLLLLAFLGWFLGRSSAPPPDEDVAASTTGTASPAAVAAEPGPSGPLPTGPQQEPSPEGDPSEDELKRRLEADVHLRLARTRLEEGDAEAALEHVGSALALVPDDPEALEIRERARTAIAEAGAVDEPPPPARPESTPPEPEPEPPPPPRVAEIPPPPPDPPPAPVPEPPPPAVPVPELWTQAHQLYDRHEFHSLRETLDRILAARPADEEAREWRNEVDEWIAEGDEEVREELIGWLEELADTIGDRDYGDVEVQWGHGRHLDEATGRFFRDLFDADHPRLAASIRLKSAEIRDREARFVAAVTIEGKDRIWRRQGEEETLFSRNWSGTFRLIDGEPTFVSPFP